MRPEDESHAILDRALRASRSDEADAVLIAADQNITRFANSTIHQNMSEIAAELTLRVISSGRMGVASTTVFDDEELARTAALAREAARHSNPLQSFSGLYRGDEPVPSLETFDRHALSFPVSAKAEALRDMFEAGRIAGLEFAGSYTTRAASIACANTNGVRRYAPMSLADATVIALHQKGSGFATSCSRRVGEVDVRALGDEAIRKATLHLDNIEDVTAGPYDVILEPAALAEVLEWLAMIAFTGQSFEDGSSFFAERLGETLLGENLTIADDASNPDFLPFPFDLEGIPKRRTVIIDRGIARTPVVDSIYASRLAIAATANCWGLASPEHGSPLHLEVAAGTSTRQELMASTALGIWVTRFNYVNGLLEPKRALMTGTTRDGTFLIRNGVVVSRLPNLRWTQSIVEAFRNIEGLTGERRRVSAWFNMFGGTLAPVVKIRGWNFTGN